MKKLKYSTTSINKNFRIKVVIKGKKDIHTIVGVSGLINLIDDMNIVNNLLEKAFESKDDKYKRKLRRGIDVTFYVK